ncbi:MAG: AI-2E family transporter [Lachnospira eligens]
MLSILVAYLIAVGAFAVLIGFVVPQIYKSITEIANQAPVWYENIRNWFTEFEDKHANSSIDYNFINQKIEDALPKLVDYMTELHLPIWFLTFLIHPWPFFRVC